MGSLMAKRISSSHFFSPSSPFLHHLQHMQHLSTSTTPSPRPQNQMSFIAQYLVSSFGFSPDRALKVSANKNLKAIRSSDRPEAVRKFLSDTGLSDTQIKAAVSIEPLVLACNADKILKPWVCEWAENGFSQQLLVQLIRYCPGALLRKRTLRNLLFWRDFVSNDVDLLKIIPRMSFLILFDIDKYIAPNIDILKGYGLSKRDIVDLLGSGSRCMSLDVDSLRQTIELIEEMGLARGSSMFLYGLKAVGSCSKDKILKKVEFYKTTYGWSQADVHCAFRKFPYMLIFSEEKIKLNMDFLITEAKLKSRSIASLPALLGYSVKKRLAPRHNVLSILTAKGLIKKGSLLTACGYTEKRFLEKYVEPYKEDVPDLGQAYYSAASAHENLSG